MKNKLGIIVLAAIIGFSMTALSLTGCSHGGDDGGSGGTTVSVTGVTLNKSNITLNVGDTETLTATVAPNSATKKTVTWSTNDEEVVTVTNGVVTAVAAGSATITVTTADGGKTAKCSVDVDDPSLLPLNGTITINPATAAINTELTAAYSGTEIVSFQWKKDGSKVGINSNKYTPKEAGSYTVTVILAGYNSKTSNAVTVTSSAQGTALTITTTSLPSGTTGIAYSQTLAATGESPITWSVKSGTLPDGLTLSTAGIISGTPVKAGKDFTFDVKATNAAGSATKSFEIIVFDLEIFSSIADFKTWLAAQRDNTAATAYPVKLNVNSLSGDSATTGSLGKALADNSTKYSSIDLSGNTFTSIGDYAFSRCTSLTSVTFAT